MLLVSTTALIVTYWRLRLWKERRSNQRIDAVVTNYVRFVGKPRPHPSGPLPFVRAGAKGLETSNEVRRAAERIEDRLGHRLSPFGEKRHGGLKAYEDLLGLVRALDEEASNWDQICEERGIQTDS